MRVWYFHGLESRQGGPKVDFLQTVAEEVYAPVMAYLDSGLFEQLLEKAMSAPPDLIIGSSMGGYFADVMGSRIGSTVLLFNPALHSRSIEINLEYGLENYTRHFVVGELDDVIDPKRTRMEAGKYESFKVIPRMGHRTSLDIFTESCLPLIKHADSWQKVRLLKTYDNSMDAFSKTASIPIPIHGNVSLWTTEDWLWSLTIPY